VLPRWVDRRVWILFLIASLAALGYAAWQHRHSRHKRQLQLSPALHVELHHLVVAGRERGKKGWELEAETVRVSRDERFTDLRQVRRGVLYSQGKPTLRLRAGTARLDAQTRDLKISNGITVDGEDGLRIRSEQANWIAERQTLVCPRPIVVSVNQVRILAPRVEYQADRKLLICPSGVRASSGRNQLRAERLVVRAGSEELALAGGLQARLNLEGARRLLADRTLSERIRARVRALLSLAPERNKG